MENLLLELESRKIFRLNKKTVESNVDSVCICALCICGDEIEGPTKRATMTVVEKRIISFGNGGCVESSISGI